MPHPVLIVDDSGFMRNIIKQILAVDDELEIAGEAEDGQVALEKEKALKPEVILLDIEMPRLDGLSALKRLKLTSKAKVVILSSLAQLGSPAALEARPARRLRRHRQTLRRHQPRSQGQARARDFENRTGRHRPAAVRRRGRRAPRTGSQ